MVSFPLLIKAFSSVFSIRFFLLCDLETKGRIVIISVISARKISSALNKEQSEYMRKSSTTIDSLNFHVLDTLSDDLEI